MKENTMPFHITIKNFQALSEAEIELENGLTIVTGATNNGKSAIVRAIESAVFNDGKDDYIKAGTDGLSVTLSNGNHVVEYVRKIKGKTDKTTYQFDNGDIQQKVGRNQLPEMEKLFNVKEVRLQNNQRKRLNFWYQNEWPFLMDATPGQLYEFLSVSSSEKYLEVLKKMFDDIKTEDTEIKTSTSAIDVLKREINRKETILAQNQGFDALFDRIGSLKTRSDVLIKSNLLLTSINDAKITSETVSKSLITVNKQINAVPFEKVSLEMKRFTESSVLMEDALKLLSSIKYIKERQHVLQENLKTISLKQEKISNVVFGLQKRIKALTLLKEFVSNITEKQNDIRLIQAVCQKKKKQLSALPKIVLSTSQQKTLQNRIEQTKEMSNWLIQRRQEIAEINAVTNRIGTVQNTLNAVNQRFNKVDKDLAELKNDLGVCPFCGSVFDYGDNKHFHFTEEEHT